MIKYYMKHAWRMLWQDKFFTIISLLGIGLAVAFIMVIFTVNDIDGASYAPEVNRYRTLYVKSLSEKHGESTNNSSLSPRLLKNVFYNIKEAEAVTGVTPWTVFVEPKKFSGEGQCVASISTDGYYWKFFEFKFIEGKPFTVSDFNSGICNAVICESLARKLYKGESALGKDIYIAQKAYRVVGVVKDVSASNKFAYGKVWIPYTTDSYLMSIKDEVSCGMLNALILAKSPSDFDMLKKRVEENRARYNQPLAKDLLIKLHGPDTHLEQRFRFWANDEESSYRQVIKIWLTVIVILMVVPAFNMANFTISRMRKRQEELGLRRSFGALRSDIIWQVISENMVITLIGGVLGFLLSIIILICFKSSLYPDGVTYSLSMFFRPAIMGYLLLTCILINLLSALIPAVRSARQPIVQALTNKRS